MNSWNLENFTVTTDGFVFGVPASADIQRKPGGSRPDIAFMRPKPGSCLLDAGISVELSVKNSAPDLGAFEMR